MGVNDCNKCLWATRDGGCASWDCKFVQKGDAYNAWIRKEGSEKSKVDKDKDVLISRQSAIDAIDEIDSEVADGYGFQYEKWRQYFCDLPSAEPKWIPVMERLPEYGIDVLTVDGYGEYEINHIIDDDEWYWEPVTAWMPLPKWKGESNERLDQ